LEQAEKFRKALMRTVANARFAHQFILTIDPDVRDFDDAINVESFKRRLATPCTSPMLRHTWSRAAR
jgi:hypothetical protein